MEREAKDIDAFKKLYVERFEAIAGFCRQYVKDKETASDLAQETFFKLYERFDASYSRENMLAFLYITAKNLCLDCLAREKFKRQDIDELKDDLLDVYGNPDVFGKNIGGDILCNKKTYLLIKAFERADEQQRRALSFWVEADTYVPEKKIAAVRALYDEIGVKTLCESLMEEYTFRARAALLSVQVPDERKQGLAELMEKLMHREV